MNLFKQTEPGQRRLTESTNLDLLVDVLGYRQGSFWVAWAPELDIRAANQTFEEAYDDLLFLLRTEVRSALFNKHPESLWQTRDPMRIHDFTQDPRHRLIEISKSPWESAIHVSTWPPVQTGQAS